MTAPTYHGVGALVLLFLKIRVLLGVDALSSFHWRESSSDWRESSSDWRAHALSSSDWCRW